MSKYPQAFDTFDIQVSEEDLTAPRPNKWRCGTVGCTYCDPDNYDGWDDEAAARQQADYDYIHCSIAKSDHDEDIAMSMCED